MTEICMDLGKYVMMVIISWIGAALAYHWGVKRGVTAACDSYDERILEKMERET